MSALSKAGAAGAASAAPGHVTVSGAPEGFDAALLHAELQRGDRSRSFMSPATTSGWRRCARRWPFSRPGVPVLTFPAWDCLPYDRVSPNPEVSAARMATLAALAHGMPGRFVLLTTLNAATQRVPAREVLREAAFTARVGHRIDEEGLREFLVRMGFSPGADGDRARRLRAARRHHRHLSAGAGGADPAGPLRRRAGRRRVGSTRPASAPRRS